MKKIVFLLFFISVFMAPALADFQVDSVDVAAEVADTGRAQVTTTVQLTFDSVTSQVTIPLPESRASDVSVGDFRFSTQDGKTGVEVTVSRSDGFAGTQTFVVRYSVPYRDTGGEEADSFSLGFLSSQWEKPIGSVSLNVLMPAAFEAEPVISSGYNGELSPGESHLAVTGSGFGCALGQRMAYDTMAASLTLPEGYFKVRRAAVPVVSLTYLTMVMAGILVLCIVYWRLKLRFRRTESRARLLLPEGLMTCQLPMALDGSTCDVPAMILEWANLGYLAISLSRRGTVVLIRRMQMDSERSAAEQKLFARIFGGKSQVAVTKGRYSAAAARFRASSRKSLYRVIFDRTGGNPVLVQLVCRVLLAVSIGYLFGQLLPEGGGFVILAVLLGIAGFVYSIYLHSAVSSFAALRRVTLPGLVSLALMPVLLALSVMAGALPEYAVGLTACLFSAIATAPGPRRSSRGADIYAQAQGCRTFYRQASWSRLQLFQGRSSRFFQRQLPRAVALGVERQFAERFERLPVPMPDWLWLPEPASRSADALRRQLKPILRQLRDGFR